MVTSAYCDLPLPVVLSLPSLLVADVIDCVLGVFALFCTKRVDPSSFNGCFAHARESCCHVPSANFTGPEPLNCLQQSSCRTSSTLCPLVTPSFRRASVHPAWGYKKLKTTNCSHMFRVSRIVTTSPVHHVTWQFPKGQTVCNLSVVPCTFLPCTFHIAATLSNLQGQISLPRPRNSRHAHPTCLGLPRFVNSLWRVTLVHSAA